MLSENDGDRKIWRRYKVRIHGDAAVQHSTQNVDTHSYILSHIDQKLDTNNTRNKIKQLEHIANFEMDYCLFSVF